MDGSKSFARRLKFRRGPCHLVSVGRARAVLILFGTPKHQNVPNKTQLQQPQQQQQQQQPPKKHNDPVNSSWLLEIEGPSTKHPLLVKDPQNNTPSNGSFAIASMKQDPLAKQPMTLGGLGVPDNPHTTGWRRLVFPNLACHWGRSRMPQMALAQCHWLAATGVSELCVPGLAHPKSHKWRWLNVTTDPTNATGWLPLVFPTGWLSLAFHPTLQNNHGSFVILSSKHKAKTPSGGRIIFTPFLDLAAPFHYLQSVSYLFHWAMQEKPKSCQRFTSALFFSNGIWRSLLRQPPKKKTQQTTYGSFVNCSTGSIHSNSTGPL